MDKNTEQWNEINELLSKNGAHLNVLEEEIDIEIQREYFNLAHSITEKPRKFKQLCKKYTENINQLFDENIPGETKKRNAHRPGDTGRHLHLPGYRKFFETGHSAKILGNGSSSTVTDAYPIQSSRRS